MKNAIIVVLVVVSGALGALYFKKASEANQVEAKLATVQQEIQDLRASAAQSDQRATAMQERLEKSLNESASNAGAAAKLSIALTNRLADEERTNAKPKNPLAEMMKNPEMREMIKKQQQTMFASMVDKNYAAFLKGQQLTPEQTAALKELIAKKMGVGAEMGMELMGGDLTAEQRADMVKQIKSSSDAVSDEIKNLLGTDSYAAFESYEKTVQDRMAISTFRDQLAGGDMALSDAQEQQLIAAMSEERNGFKFTTDFSNQNDFSEDVFSKFSEENLNRFFDEQDGLNQKYLARAQTILSTDQYASYQKSLKAQQDMMRMGMKMAASMFGNKK